MSIQTELTRITNAKAAIKTAIEGKGVTVPDGTLLDGMAALIESIEADLSVHNRKVLCGSFVPAESSYSITIPYDLASLGGSYPSGCMFWVVSDVIENVDAPSHILGCYISDFFGKSSSAKPTWGRSVAVYEKSAGNTSNEPKASTQLLTQSGGDIGYPWSTSNTGATVMSFASSHGVRLGGTGSKFVAGLEYQYILFGGLET